MTFSIAARDETGAIGIALSSSSPAVAARCIHLRGGVGGVASQNITDPRYGPTILSALASGAEPARALAELLDADPTAEYRQVVVVDREGRTAEHSGKYTLGRHATAQTSGAIAAGNLLASASVPGEMIAAFSGTTGDLELRLFAAMQAGLRAGGEEGAVHSCGLAVVRGAGWNETDLRIDWAEEDPVGELGRLLSIWLPQRDDYVTRGMHPETAPSYGVPGDE